MKNIGSNYAVEQIITCERRLRRGYRISGRPWEEVISEPQIFWDVSVAYQETEQYNKAKANYELAYSHFTNNPTFLKEYGLFLREEGEYAKSQEVLRNYLELEPEDTEILSLFD